MQCAAPVWAVPFSLAATWGISRYTSHCFLFLSVLRCFTSRGTHRDHLCITILEGYSSRFPHSEISGSKVIRHLPEAYRRQSRLSSLCRAKASTVCSSLNFLLGNLEIMFTPPAVRFKKLLAGFIYTATSATARFCHCSVSLFAPAVSVTHRNKQRRGCYFQITSLMISRKMPPFRGGATCLKADPRYWLLFRSYS